MSDLTLLWTYLPLMLTGALVTLEISLLAFLLAAVLGLLLGLMRATRIPWLHWPAVAYIEIVRSVPILVILFLLFYGIPILLGLDVPGFPAGVLALGLAESAYMAEVVRGGVEAVGKEQWDAAYSLSMRFPTVLRFVVLPQALRLALPPAVNLYVNTIKNSSLVLSVGVVELMTVTSAVRDFTLGRATLVVFLVAAVMYFAMCYSLSAGAQWLERTIHV